jgi:hypothetical protein
VLEQDPCFLKKRIAASLGFRSVDGALRTIQGYEAMKMNKIRKGQIPWLAKGHVVAQAGSSIKSSASLLSSKSCNARPVILLRCHLRKILSHHRRVGPPANAGGSSL